MKRKGFVFSVFVIVLLAVIAVRIDAPAVGVVNGVGEDGAADLQILDVNPEVKEGVMMGYQDLEEQIAGIQSASLGVITRANPGFVINSSTYLIKIYAPTFEEIFCGSQLYNYNFFLNTTVMNAHSTQVKAALEVIIIDSERDMIKDISLFTASIPGRTNFTVPIKTFFTTQALFINKFDVYIKILPSSEVPHRAGERIMLFEWFLRQFEMFGQMPRSPSISS